MAIKRFILFATLLGLASMVPGFRDFGPQAAGKPRPVVRFATRTDTTAPLRQMPEIPPMPEVLGEIFEKPLKRLPNRAGGGGGAAPDPVVQTIQGGAAPATTGDSFDGLGIINGVLPPDPAGAIGLDHYVQMTNLSFAIWRRSDLDDEITEPFFGPVDNNTLWQGFGGPCEKRNDGDPIVLYDELAGRWLMSQFALPRNGPYSQCIAVSTSEDPLGAWYRYEFLISETKLNDYPKFGVWPDGYYMAVNQFVCQGPFCSWGGQGVVAFNRVKMLAGDPSAEMVYFDMGLVDLSLGGMLPADLDGPAPPTDTPNFFVEVDANEWGFSQDHLQIWEFAVDWVTPTSSSFSALPDVATAEFDPNMCGGSRNCIPQPGGSDVDAIADRLMYRLQYRNFSTELVNDETLVVNHTVDVGDDRAGVRWYELNDDGTGWSMAQQGTYAPDDGDHRWMGSAAMNGAGDIALGYSVSSENTFPSVRFTGRLHDDALGLMTIPEGTIVDGSGYQTHGSGRWGDYSMLTVDPRDDCTFWYTQEYYADIGNAPWRTRIGSFKLANCATVANDPNDVPVLLTVIADQATDEDAPFSLDVSGNFSDPDNQPQQALAYSVTGPGWLGIDASMGVLSGTPVNDDVGNSSVTVTASDGQDSVSDTFSMTVNNTNDAPVLVSSIADQTAAVGAPFSLDVSGNFDDVDVDDMLTFSALDGGGALPAWLFLDPNLGVFSGTPASTDMGAVNVEVTASDGSESVSDTFVITVNDAAPDPAVTGCSPNFGSLNQRLTVTVSGTDFQDGATVDFGARIAIQGVTFDSVTQHLDVRIKIQRRAATGLRAVTVTNPDGGSYTLANCFTVNQ